MAIFINPGSGPIPDSDEFTNTYEQALLYAREWLEKIAADGIDVEMTEPDPASEDEGRWTFLFRHPVTDVTIELDQHGVAPLEAYARGNLFGAYPRVYWDGSSSYEPEIEQWAAPGFRVVKTFTALPSKDGQQ